MRVWALIERSHRAGDTLRGIYSTAGKAEEAKDERERYEQDGLKLTPIVIDAASDRY